MQKAAVFAAAFFHMSQVVRHGPKKKFAKENFLMYNKMISGREEVTYVCPLSIS